MPTHEHIKPGYLLKPVDDYTTNPFPIPVTTKVVNVEKDHIQFAYVSDHWPEILQARHMTAMVRFGHAHLTQDEKKIDQAAAYLAAIEVLMDIDNVEPLDLGSE